MTNTEIVAKIRQNLKNNLIIIIFCFFLTLLFAVPMLNGVFQQGPDTLFHINRIDALVTAINNGDMYPYVLLNQNYQFGYGSPLFYSIFFLYFPAWLQIGFNIMPVVSYRILLCMITFFGAMSMCVLCIKVVTKKPNIYAFISTFLYILNSFYLSNIYKRGAVGECLAFVFVPIVLLGIYYALYKEEVHWKTLTFGFAGLLLSHNITFLLMVFLFAIAIIVRFKFLLINKRNIVCIGLAALSAFGLTAFFSLPMLEQLNTGYYRISNYFGSATALKETAANLHGLFEMSLDNGVYLNNSLGLGLMILPLTILLCRKAEQKKFPLFCMILGYVFVFMASDAFPWEFFSTLSFIQFPTRFLTPASSLMALAACYGLSKCALKKEMKTIFVLSSTICVVLITLVQTYQLYNNYGLIYNDFTDNDLKDDAYYYGEGNQAWYNQCEISSPDYLVTDSNIHYYDEYYSELGGRRITSNNEEDRYQFDESNYNSVVFTSGEISTGTVYVLPKTYYKGYEVESTLIDADGVETKQADISTDIDPETGNVSFAAPTFAGPGLMKFNLVYKGTSIQKISRVISIMSLCIIIALSFFALIYNKQKK